MNLRVLMPMIRPQNIPVLANAMRGDVLWHPVIEGGSNIAPELPDEDWVSPLVVGSPPDEWKAAAPYWKLNQAIDMLQRWHGDCADDYYSFMADDCLWELFYWQKVRAHLEHAQGKMDVLVTSQQRHGFFLQAQPERMKSFSCDFTQFTLRGSCFLPPHNVRFENLWFADSYLAEVLASKFKHIAFAPECVAYYNALRAECWGFPQYAAKEKPSGA